MGRTPCCEKVGLKRGPWTPDEDEKLVSFISEHGHGSWRALPKKAGLLRCGKSCRLRWTNYLRPDIKRGEFTASEEHTILQLHALLGNRWSAIASHLPKRTDNEIKNYWNTHLKKKLLKMGLDPTTHKPLADSVLMSNSGNIDKSSSGLELDKPNSSSKTSAVSSSIAKVSASDKEDNGAASLLLRGTSLVKGSSATMHLTQWESVRLEAEARLTQEAKMRAKGVWRRNENSSAGPTSVIKSSVPGDVAGSASLETLKGVSAVELMHALHNWEKSLQGQAGILWPESWRVVSTHASQSCVHSESSCSSSSHPTADVAPNSSTCLDSRKATEEQISTSTTSPVRPHSPPSKLCWSDTLILPKYPVSSTKSTNEFWNQLEGATRGTFSSLMLDAVLGRSLMQEPTGGAYVSHKAEAAHGSVDQKGGSCDKLKGAATHHMDKQHFDEASNVSAVTGEMQDEAACTDDDERSLSADGTSDLFKDLPKLKRDATTTPVSYTALLSEEISDYWSNIVLKEQVASPTIHITF